MVFDNTKIKSTVPGWVATVPFAQGAARSSTGTTPTPAASGRAGAGRRDGRLVAAYAVGS